jgi:hypothetical protein
MPEQFGSIWEISALNELERNVWISGCLIYLDIKVGSCFTTGSVLV